MSEQGSPDVSVRAKHSLRDLASRLYRGEAGVDVVGKRKYFYGVAGLIVLIAIVTVLVRPFNFGIEFKGGTSFTVPASAGSLDQVRTAFTDAGADVVTSQSVGSPGGGTGQYSIKTALLDQDATAASAEASRIKTEVAKKFNISPDTISESSVSGSWSGTVSKSAVTGALIFLAAVMIYLWAALREWRMSVAALAALLQNLILTATIYLLLGFEITPSTIIGFLTILGFALYDVVVVFDKVRENTRGITGSPNRTYGEAANLAVNQTLMRSINTAVVALLPVGGLLFIGAGLLGAGTLKDLGLVLFVGMLAAVYSSIFLATPVLVDLKEREPRFKLHKQRVLQRRAAATNVERKSLAKTKSDSGGSNDSGSRNDSDAGAEDEPALAGTGATGGGGGAPRPGSRPQQQRKRPAGAKPGGKPGSRSGGRKR